MRIELTEGCICDSFTADDRQLIDMSAEELMSILIRVVDKISKTEELKQGQTYGLQDAIRSLVEYFYDEDEASEEACDCCGGFVETYYMEV